MMNNMMSAVRKQSTTTTMTTLRTTLRVVPLLFLFLFLLLYSNSNSNVVIQATALVVTSARTFKSRSATTSSRSSSSSQLLLAANTNNTNKNKKKKQKNWFQNFIGGGAYNLQIDYRALDFPGSELGQLAVEHVAAAASSSSSSTARTTTTTMTHSPTYPQLAVATFAGGCFWGLDLAFARLPGVVYTTVGYTQGHSRRDNFPTYEHVCAGNTDHTEAVCVYFQPPSNTTTATTTEEEATAREEGCTTTYDTLLETYLARVDITTVNGQGQDAGRQYRTGIYYHTPAQEQVARHRLTVEIATNPKYTTNQNQKNRIATECQPATLFWPAEQYHQQYLEKGGRYGTPQSAQKGCTDPIQCYG